MLEVSNFSFRYVRLCDLDIPREKWLNYLASDLGLQCLLITPFEVSRQFDKREPYQQIPGHQGGNITFNTCPAE